MLDNVLHVSPLFHCVQFVTLRFWCLLISWNSPWGFWIAGVIWRGFWWQRSSFLGIFCLRIPHVLYSAAVYSILVMRNTISPPVVAGPVNNVFIYNMQCIVVLLKHAAPQYFMNAEYQRNNGCVSSHFSIPLVKHLTNILLHGIRSVNIPSWLETLVGTNKLTVQSIFKIQYWNEISWIL